MTGCAGIRVEAHVVTVLDGINLYDRARLLEEGVESVENLAHSSLVELILRTRIPTARLVDLFDQAILYLHLATGDEPPRDSWGLLRSYGIRTATDLLVACERLPRQSREAVLGLLPDTKGTKGVSRLRVIREVLQDDEWIVYLQHWRTRFGCDVTLRQPEDLDDL
jgi:hypothetical protein